MSGDAPKFTPEQLYLMRAMQHLTQSNIELRKSVDSLANSLNDIAVIIENADEMAEGLPPGYKPN